MVDPNSSNIFKINFEVKSVSFRNYLENHLMETKISVKPFSSNNISSLVFNGFSAVRGGDLITAWIPRVIYLGNGNYTPKQNLQETEQSICLITTENFNKILREEYSFDYDQFRYLR